MFNKLKEKILPTVLLVNYKKIFPYFKKYWARAVMSVLITIPLGSMDAVIAWCLKPYMDTVMVAKSSTYNYFIPILIIVFSMVQAGLTYTSSYLNAWVGTRVTMDLKMDLFKKLLRMDAAYFDKTSSGTIQLRFNGDADSTCSGLLSNSMKFFTTFFSSVSLLGVLIWNSWQLSIIAIVILLAALYPLSTIRKRIKGIVEKTVFSGSQVATHYNEAFMGNRVITSYNLHEYIYGKFVRTINDLFHLGMKMVQRTSILSPIMHFVVSIGIAGVIWYGSYLITTDQLTPGGFVSFITALLLLYTPIKKIGSNYNGVQISLMAMERVFELLDKKSEIINKTDAVKLTEINDNICYKNVCFEYTKDKPVLENINLTIKKGDITALVGNSGGGKTTFVNLLPRFYDVTKGSITIDGTDVRDINLDSLRENIAIVFQDNVLFDGSIRDNILLGKENATQTEIDYAVKNACLNEFISTLEKGLDTQVGERGVLLSGGQKQRIAIARAFIKNAPIVILDEATSALDNKSEAVVQTAIYNLMKDRTVFIIAHRLSTVKNADRIVVINYGEITESGTHEELISKPNSAYSLLYKTQIK